MRKTILLLLSFMPFLSNAQEAKKKKPRPKPGMGVQASLIRGPYLQVPTTHSMIIRWRTNVLDRSRVKYGLSPDSLTMTVDDSLLVMDHEVALTDLRPGTKYYYSIGNFADTTLSRSTQNHFTTLPVNNDSLAFRVMALGDMGNGSANQIGLRNAIEEYIKDKPIDAWVTLGDNVYADGMDAEFQAKFFDIYQRPLLANYGCYLIPGNHDYHDQVNVPAGPGGGVPYFFNFSMPQKGEAGGVPSGTKQYYSFDIGNVHYIAIDSYGKDESGLRLYEKDSRQLKWLTEDLAASRNKKWIVVLIHHPPYSKGSHDSDKEKELIQIRQVVTPVIESYGVDVVLSGHSHLYERTKLIYGYTGFEKEYDPKLHAMSGSSGKMDGSENSAPYKKGKDNKGTVYVVAGSGGQLSGISEGYPHDAHYYSNNKVPGALIIESKGNRLTVKWLTMEKKIGDEFTILKDVDVK